MVPSFSPQRLCGISLSFLRLSPTFRQIPTRYSPVRHSPSYYPKIVHAAVRLACVKHAASVQSEPGSNSSFETVRNSCELLFFKSRSFCLLKNSKLTKAPTQITYLLFMQTLQIFKERLRCFYQRRIEIIQKLEYKSTPYLQYI